MTALVPVLMYHSVTDEPPASFARWTVSTARLESHLDVFDDGGYRTVTVSEHAAALRGEGTLPDRPVVVTFDDGFRDNVTEALPALRRRGMRATVYVATGFLGGVAGWLDDDARALPMLSPAEVLELRDNGIEIGAHGHRHAPLDEIPRDDARNEIVRSGEILRELGAPATSFAYPHGYFDRAVRASVRDAGFSSACTVAHAMSSDADDPFAIVRIIVDRDVTDDALARLLRGDGLRVAPVAERIRTKAWRAARRQRRRLGAAA